MSGWVLLPLKSLLEGRLAEMFFSVVFFWVCQILTLKNPMIFVSLIFNDLLHPINILEVSVYHFKQVRLVVGFVINRNWP